MFGSPLTRKDIELFSTEEFILFDWFRTAPSFVYFIALPVVVALKAVVKPLLLALIDDCWYIF